MKRVLVCLLALAMLLASTALAESAEPVTLTYWLPCNDLEAGAAEQSGIVIAAQKFMESHPNIKLDLVPIGGNSDDYNSKFQMSATANNLPDLMNISYGYVKQWAGTGVILPLDDIVAEIKDNYKTDALDFANEAVDGYWAIPYMAEVLGWAYNTEILGQYGLEVPETFDDFINVCKVLTDNGVRAIAHGATDIWPSGATMRCSASTAWTRPCATA